ncbi:protein required for some forms of polarized growth, localized to sites of polarized growth [Scheffersomyces amazonensis]|uniref:protein required for some forms of polarized growth, localized to sites of polarized growth n=1 Tax=Scheffersomyces amazonensis TaxID=1078765 RepID=UPI00315D7DBC
MINAETFKKTSPYKITHNDTASHYNLANTTAELLKFQLQEQYRTKLQDLKESRFPENSGNSNDLQLLHTSILHDSFNSHLQSNLDKGHVTISHGQSVVSNDSSISSLSMISTPNSEVSDNFELESVLESKNNYLNLKVLIENSIFDTSKINNNAIMSLPMLRIIKSTIEEKRELQQYLLEKTHISQQFIKEIILSEREHEQNQSQNQNPAVDIDAKLLSQALRSTTSLQDQLLRVNQELDQLTTQLNNHNMACLVLGYVEDVTLSSSELNNNQSSDILGSNSTANDSGLKSSISANNLSMTRGESLHQSFEVLFSHIASKAAQSDVQLPSPPATNDSIDSRIRWACDCIDKITRSDTSPPATATTSYQSTPPKKSDISFLNENSFFSNSSPKNSTTDSDKVLAEYRTALTDLRFSYQYLCKEYELSRENSQKLIQEYRKKIHQLETDITRSGASTTATPTSTTFNSINNSTASYNQDSIQLKDKEISKLRKEINLLKVDKLGFKANSNGSNFSLLGSPKFNESSSISPITGELLQVPDIEQAPTDNDDQRSVGSALSPSRPNSGYGGGSMSSAILRKEFKKIISDMQDHYEIELSEEKLRRKQIQAQLDKVQGHSI